MKALDLTKYSLEDLDVMVASLHREQGDTEFKNVLAAEIERRLEAGEEQPTDK